MKELTGPWQQWAEPESLLEVQLKDNELHLHRSDNHHDGFLKAVRTRQDPVSDAEATHVASYPGLIAEIAARLETKLSKPAPQECVSPAGTGPPK